MSVAMRNGESLPTWLLRLRFNLFPAFRRTGARLVYISENRRALRIRLPLNRQTRNIYGTLFGGAIYAAVDPLYALLIKTGLGKDYIVWDKAGTIRYLKPARSTLFAECSISDAELAGMRDRLALEASANVDYEISLVDAYGEPHAKVMKTIYVSRKQAYYERQKQKAGQPDAE